ncbi:MAG: hypothetical protein JJV99_10470 [Colwellia sp.]|nr:hypothetical protein [Colwellia sp.]
MDKLKMHSLDMTVDNIEKIAALFPNCITEVKCEIKSESVDAQGKLTSHLISI